MPSSQNGHFSRTARQRTCPHNAIDYMKKRTSTSSLTCGHQTALILIQWIVLFVVAFGNASITGEIRLRRKLNTVEELKRAIIAE